MIPRLAWPAPVRLLLGLALVSLSSCQRTGAPTDEAQQVARVFAAFQDAVMQGNQARACTYVPGDVDRYLASVRPDAVAPANAGDHPTVDLLLRRALAQRAPPELRDRPTLAALLQRAVDRHLFDPRDLRNVALGQISVSGDHASAPLTYRGTPTPLPLSFVKEPDGWKIDLLTVLPDVETMLRVGRLLKGQTEEQQVDALVAHIPAL
jgi:hypothetical protein